MPQYIGQRRVVSCITYKIEFYSNWKTTTVLNYLLTYLQFPSYKNNHSFLHSSFPSYHFIHPPPSPRSSLNCPMPHCICIHYTLANFTKQFLHRMNWSHGAGHGTATLYGFIVSSNPLGEGTATKLIQSFKPDSHWFIEQSARFK